MMGRRPLSDIGADRQMVEHHLESLLPPGSDAVPEAMRYAVLGGGQRIRPLLALRVGRLLGVPASRVLQPATAIELLHCASLIVDDLPCMDDAAERRERAAVHIAFGQATAVLASFALVGLAARSVLETSDRDRLVSFQVELLRMLDCSALVGGQAMDLLLSGELRNQHRVQVAQRKTVPLFQLAVRAGMALAEPAEVQRESLCGFGREFGIAFQMADDFMDDDAVSGPAVQRQLDAARRCLEPLGAASDPLADLVDYLHERTTQKRCCHR